MSALRRIAFVLLPSGSGAEERFQNAIKPACEAASLNCRRVQDSPSHGELLQEIYRELDHADVIIADLSENNPNVYFELGIGVALKRPTILIAESIDKLPFDVKAFPVVAYQGNVANLQTMLSATLAELMRPIAKKEAILPPRTLTLVVGDLVGFTSIAAQELDARENLLEYLGRVRNSAIEHDSIDFSNVGDGFIATFERTDNALTFAQNLQNVVERIRSGTTQLRLALHRSPIVIRRTRHGTEMSGDGINIAARLQNVAGPGQIILSAAAVADLSPGRLPRAIHKVVELKHVGRVEATVVETTG